MTISFNSFLIIYKAFCILFYIYVNISKTVTHKHTIQCYQFLLTGNPLSLDLRPQKSASSRISFELYMLFFSVILKGNWYTFNCLLGCSYSNLLNWTSPPLPSPPLLPTQTIFCYPSKVYLYVINTKEKIKISNTKLFHSLCFWEE